jgi:hypothetical protein
MYTSDAVRVVGSKSAIADSLGISRQAVNKWGDLVPPLSAAKLAKRHKRLKFDPDLYDDWYSGGKSAH